MASMITNSHIAVPPPQQAVIALLSGFLALLKLRIGVAMGFTTLAAMVVTPGPSPTLQQTLLLAFLVMVSASAAGGFNHYYDYDIDTVMNRTRGRPFVTGQLRRSPRWLVVLAAMLVFSVVATAYVFNPLTAAHLFFGAFFYGVVYTVWLKRRTWVNIVIGGAAGSFAVFTGSSAIGEMISPVPLALALVLFLWTPSHFWSLAIALREDYAAARIPMLPVVAGDRVCAKVILANTTLLVLATLGPWLLGLGSLYLAGALTAGGFFLYRSLLLWRHTHRANAMANFHASLIHLAVVLASAVADIKLAHLL